MSVEPCLCKICLKKTKYSLYSDWKTHNFVCWFLSKHIGIMKNTFKKVFIGFMAFAMATGSFAQQRAHKKDNESYPKEWKQIARMEQDSFFLTDEARRIAENVLAFQRCTGGWPKNIDMARRMNDKELAKVIKDKSRRDDSTIDNNATTAQMIF